MSDVSHPIPTSLILGFLGVGKTTAILDLMKHKPEHETWAVLVNEFGEVGIDGALLQTEGTFIKEVPGGCMCCVAGLPMQIGLNQLIRQARPDRLLIEPTGLGHPSRILETLTSEHYRDVLAIGPVITLVDPRKLENPKVLENVQFRDQVAAADIVVANKTDLCSEEQLARFDDWVSALAKERVFRTRYGKLSPAWLDGESDLQEVSAPTAHQQHQEHPETTVPDIEEQPWQLVTNRGQGYFSVGWRIHPQLMFDENALMAVGMGAGIARFKAVVRCLDGWRAINVVDGSLSVLPAEPRELSRIELISETEPDTGACDRVVRAAAGLD